MVQMFVTDTLSLVLVLLYRKWHAYYGIIYALFVMEIIGDALEEIKNSKENDPSVLCKTLETKEINHY